MSFILDDLYQEIPEYPRDETYLRRFLFYRRSKSDGIDVDVCKHNMDIYLKTNDIFKNYSSTECKLQEYSQRKYEIHTEKEVYRGETLVNCMQVLLQIANYEQKSLVLAKEIDEIEKRINITNIVEHSLLEQFICQCYSEGNFLTIPFVKSKSLNQAKGYLRRQGYNFVFRDDWYTYLDGLTKYFKTGTLSCRLVELIDCTYSNWRVRYKEAENGILQFVSDNHLDSFYQNGVPKLFWNITDKGFSNDLNCYLKDITQAMDTRTQILLEIMEEAGKRCNMSN